MTGVIYARYSEGPRQTDQSIEGQVADCRDYAAKNGIDIIGVYADRHISGKSANNRAEFQKMLHDAEHGRFEVVIVWKIDRFGRNRQDIALCKLRLKKAGVRLLYAAESVPEGPEGIVLESVLEGIAEYYSAELRQKVMRGQRETAKKGLHGGAPLPIGYKTDENRHIVLDPVKAPVVQEVFRMYAKGAGVKDCVDFLNERGILGARGGKITKAVVYRMVRNEHYLGHFDEFGVVLEAEPLIDKTTFETCQKQHAPARHNGAGRAQVNYMLSCKVFCGYCGAMVIGESGTGKKGKVYNYYKCGTKKRGGSCGLKPISKEKIEAAVVRATIEDMLTDETIRDLTDEILRIQEEEEKTDPAELLRKQLEQNRRKQRNILAAIEEGAGARGLGARLVELEDEERSLEVDIQKAELEKPRLTRETIEEWLKSFRGGDANDEDFCQRLIDTFIAKVEVRDGAAAIFYNITDSGNKKAASRSVRLRDAEWSSRCRTRTPKPFMYKDFAVLLIAV